jgi:Arc/MetJ family transcription regulator
MKMTMNIDDALVAEAMQIYGEKTKTAIVDLALRELVRAARRRRIAEAYGSQPELRAPRRRRGR